MIFDHLTQSQRDELGVVSQQAIGRVVLRAHMTLLSDSGFTVPRTAAIHAYGEDVARTRLRHYEQPGISKLEDEPRTGRPLNDHLACQILAAQASPSPPCSVYMQACCSMALLTAYFRCACIWCSRVPRCGGGCTGWA